MLKKIFLIFIFNVILINLVSAQSGEKLTNLLNKRFDFSLERTTESQYFITESCVKTFNPDGTIGNKDTYKLFLNYSADSQKYICKKFEIQFGDSNIVNIPALADWSYQPSLGDSESSNDSLVFGISHSNFENLSDNNGKKFSPEKSYFIYNTFIDFHAFCNVFAEKTSDGKGIQDLSQIGDGVVHEAAYSKPPVNLGTNVKEGSYFQNGEITLFLKGVTLYEGDLSAIVNYDSGESFFQMIMEPMPNMIVDTKGSSHYFGDIYINTNTNWVQKVIMDEIVVAQTKMAFPPFELNSTTERHCEIINVSVDKFMTD